MLERRSSQPPQLKEPGLRAVPLPRVLLALAVLAGLVVVARVSVGAADVGGEDGATSPQVTASASVEPASRDATLDESSRAAAGDATGPTGDDGPGEPPQRRGRWTLLPPHPVLERRSALVGARGLVFAWGGGGWDDRDRPLPLRADGAVLNLDTMRWGDMPPGPLEPRLGHMAVWTGTELVVWGGSGRERLYADGAAYDPARRRWRRLARSPLRPRQHAQGIWTGREVLVVGGQNLRGFTRDAAAYDPDTDTWRKLPLPPAEPGADAGLVTWALGRTVSSPPLSYGPTGPETVGVLHALPPGADRWEPLALPSLGQRQMLLPASSGDRLVLAVSGNNFRTTSLAVLSDTEEPWRLLNVPDDVRVADVGFEGDQVACTPSSCFLPLAGGGLLSVDPATGAWALVDSGRPPPATQTPRVLVTAGEAVLVAPSSWGPVTNQDDVRIWSPDDGAARTSDASAGRGRRAAVR